VLEEAGCTVIRQNCNPNSSFPSGIPDPTESKVLQRLADRVLKEKADIGFSYDADGDRLGIVDEKGNLIWNDTLVSLLAQDVLFFEPGAKIIYNTLCSKLTTDTIKKAGGVPVMWKTGHSFIKAKIKQEKAAFGGELSGHIFFVDNFYGHDDAIYGSLRLLQFLGRVNLSLSQAVSKLGHYVTSPEIKLGCPDKIKFGLIDKKISADLKKLFKKASYITIDGFRADTKDEMVIIRASQNGPYITVKFEARTQQKYDWLKREIAKMLHKYKDIDFSSGVNVDALR
jgi:phosphomannomutase / phosphoglucomutase